MAYYEDLTRYEYSKYPFRSAGEQYNVGWLERCEPYSKGDVSPELTTRLLALCKWPVNRYRGWHHCHFCDEYPVRITDSEGEFRLGDGEIRVAERDGNLIYVAPNLIHHYVAAHRYLPPESFLETLRKMTLPNPAVVWTLEWIENFQHKLVSITNLSLLLERIGHGDRPTLPPDLVGVVLGAANELNIADKMLGQDAEQTAESIVHRLKSVLTNRSS